ncbi:hypothetical protein A9Q97_01745 [Rhodospirillales bacterium 47_12_T64]|nr:hypothetical protein A9Q97_01745 [Rhodospirillales bacterium 47_12_T64]
MKSLCALFGPVIFICCLGLTSQAQEKLRCPRSIATIGNSVMAEASKGTLLRVYDDLGCHIILEELPGRRGIASFNNSIVDGEMYRLRIVEPRYTRKFVRSAVPIFLVSGSLWRRPNSKGDDNLPTGHVFGIVWQEKYMEGRRGKVFNTVEEAFKSYEVGEINSFLASDFAVRHRISEDGFSIVPDQGERLMEAPIYHYLGEEFTPFMNFFSSYIKKHSPFALMEITDEIQGG